ncbi:hypothetical protein BYT27DRAFT_7050858, partial [Phlegmacium glaucopus]
PWAQPAARLAMDQFHKMDHVREEIVCLNVEIKQMVTYMQDEERFLQCKEEETKETNVALVHQIYLYHMQQAHFASKHM